MSVAESERERRVAEGQLETAKAPRLVAGVAFTAIIAASVWVLSGGTLPFQSAPPPPTPTRVAYVRINLPDDALGRSAGRVGAPAPNFEWESPDGTRHTLAELRGQVVVLNFWATWCPPCRAEMPVLQRVAQAESGARFIEVDYQEDQDQVATFFERLDLRDLTPIIDPNGETARRYGVAGGAGLPWTFFIGRDGMIRHVEIGGPMDEAAIHNGVAAAGG